MFTFTIYFQIMETGIEQRKSRHLLLSLRKIQQLICSELTEFIKGKIT